MNRPEDLLTVSCGDALRSTGPTLPFGWAAFGGVSAERLGAALEEERRRLPARLDEEGELIGRRVECFDTFFRSRRFRCPLPDQLAKARRQGLPRINPFVDALLLCEMTTGLLMGVQDLGRLRGGLVYDLAAQGESFHGMRSEVRCRDGEIVLRDDEGIIASYFQGPDHRTRISPATRDVVLFAFAAPGISAGEVDEAVARAATLFGPAGERQSLGVLRPEELPAT